MVSVAGSRVGRSVRRISAGLESLFDSDERTLAEEEAEPSSCRLAGRSLIGLTPPVSNASDLLL